MLRRYGKKLTDILKTDSDEMRFISRQFVNIMVSANDLDVIQWTHRSLTTIIRHQREEQSLGIAISSRRSKMFKAIGGKFRRVTLNSTRCNVHWLSFDYHFDHEYVALDNGRQI